MKYNPVGWFEIPATDINRAKTFYEKVFGFTMEITEMGGAKMAWFPNAGEAYGAMGSLIEYEAYVPSHHGSLVYISAKEDLQQELDSVEDAGGKILQAKTQISPQHGYMALFEDSEGNRVALHSRV